VKLYGSDWKRNVGVLGQDFWQIMQAVIYCECTEIQMGQVIMKFDADDRNVTGQQEVVYHQFKA
jgi:hypothetical protein